MKNSRGFTLLELIIVVAMIGIMAAIAIPAVMSWLPNYKLKAAARDLYSAAIKAKSEAVKRNQNCALVFNQTVGGETNAYIVFVDADGDSEFDAAEQVVYQKVKFDDLISLDLTEDDGDGLSFPDNDDGNPTIAFRSNAIPTGNGGGFADGTAYLINTKGDKRNIIVNRSGNVRIE